MKYFLLPALIGLAISSIAQTTKQTGVAITQAGPKVTNPDSPVIYSFVEQMPRPTVDVMDFLSKNIHYPDSAKRNNIQGRVAIQFVVYEDGTLHDFKAVRGIGYGCDEEAIRVLKMLPPWKPAKLEGKNVKVYYTQPISFMLK